MNLYSENPLKWLAKARASALSIKSYWHKQGQSFGGAHVISARGEGFQWADIRPYQFGDETKWMSWKHTARTGEPFIKTFEVERAHKFVLLLDRGPSMLGGILKNRYERAWLLSAVMGYLVINQKDTCITYDSSQKALRKQLAIHQHDNQFTRWAVEMMDQHQRDTNPDSLSDQLLHLAEIYKRRSSWVILTDGIDNYDHLYKTLKLVSAKQELLVILFPDLFYTSQKNFKKVKGFGPRLMCSGSHWKNIKMGSCSNLNDRWFSFWHQMKLPQVKVFTCLPEDNLLVFARKLLVRS
jgi:hypothetical protein